MVRKANKTKPTEVDPEVFLSRVENTQRREDSLVLLEFFKRVTGMPPKMWGQTIIGFGRYHYKYDSGREGDWLMTGFSPRKTALTVYLLPGYADLSKQLVGFGKHKTSKSCIYINKLVDVDMKILEDVILNGVENLRDNYPTWDS